MTEHLTSQQVTDWRSGVTAAEEILRLDDHLAECAQCRSLVAGDLKSSVQALQAQFAQAHLTESELDDYAAHRPVSADAMQHLDQCADCRADADDLRRFADENRASYAPSPAPDSARRSVLPWQYSLAAALVFGLVGISLWFVFGRQNVVAPAAPVEVAANIPPQFQAEVKAAMESGTLHIPSAILGLAGGPIQLRSADAPAAASAFRVVSPIATGVVEDRPPFQWTPVEGATYNISVYDDQFRPVASATALKVTEWRPEKPLARDASYRWEVRALKGGRTDRAPGQTEPEARFTILSAETANKLKEAVATMPDKPVALGILFANVGALQDAKRSLTIAAESPTDRAAALGLLNQLK